MAKQFEYEQQLRHLKMTIQEIKEMLDSKPVQYAFIVHNKDSENREEDHLHVMVKLLNSDMQAKDLCKWFNDEPQYINIKQSRWGNKLSYLCHRTPNDKDKYQYEPADVVANFDYITELEKIQKQVETALNINDIMENIGNGTIREYNLTDYVNVNTFSKYKTKLLNALEWYRRKVMTDKDRNIRVMIFSGETGTYKTTYAKKYCQNAKKSFCISSSSNDPMQDYKGEEVLILDDLRDDAFKFNDFLKILDNHTNSTISSRYQNKAFIGDTIIITSSKNIVEWYKNEKKEDRDQLFRRVPISMTFDKEFITVYHFNEQKKIYEMETKVPNIAVYSEEKKKEFVLDTLEKMGVQMSEEMKQQLRATKLQAILDEEDLPY